VVDDRGALLAFPRTGTSPRREALARLKPRVSPRALGIRE